MNTLRSFRLSHFIVSKEFLQLMREALEMEEKNVPRNEVRLAYEKAFAWLGQQANCTGQDAKKFFNEISRDMAEESPGKSPAACLLKPIVRTTAGG